MTAILRSVQYKQIARFTINSDLRESPDANDVEKELNTVPGELTETRADLFFIIVAYKKSISCGVISDSGKIES